MVKRNKTTTLKGASSAQPLPRGGGMLKAKFHYTSWFGASSELASVMEFGFNTVILQRDNKQWV